MLAGSNYYEILGVNTDSSILDIKKSYFSLVRKYPPERFPEEFKRIREAYDTLSDTESRNTYHSSINNNGFEELFDKADNAYHEHRYEEAVMYLDKALKISPGHRSARCLMGFCYEYMHEIDKSVDIFRKLTYDFPDKAKYYYNLGAVLNIKKAYKQAVEAFNTSIRLGNTEIDTWKELGLSYFKQNNYNKAREVLLEGIQKCGGNTSIYMCLIYVDVDQKNLKNLVTDVEKLEKLAKVDKEMSENVAWTLAEIAANIIADMPEFAAKLLEKAKKLDPLKKEIKSLVKDASKLTKLNEPFERLSKDSAIHSWIKDIVRGKLFGYKSPINKMDLDISERLILWNPINMLSSVKHISTAYPEIFKEYMELFQTILDNPKGAKTDEKKLLKDIKEIEELSGREEDTTKLRLEDIVIPPMPYIKTETAGRNETCPCGSGKKYKKCCLDK